MASAASRRARTGAGLPKPVIPRYSGWSLGMTSPRRQLAITGTWRSSANRTRSFEHRARSTPAPARITGRSAAARKWSTARMSDAEGASGCGRTMGTRVPCRDRERQDVLREGDERGPRAPLQDGTHGSLEGLRGRGRIVDLPGPLGQAADPADEVGLLEGLPSAVAALDLADEREHGRGVGGGRVDADGEVGGADDARAEADGGAAGQLAVGLGGEGGGSLVARGDDPDAGRPRGRRGPGGSSRRAR